MRIALLGATGFVGSAILNEALDWGHTVAAVAMVPSDHQRLNPGWKDPNLYDEQVRGAAAEIRSVGECRHQASSSGWRRGRLGGQPALG